VNEWVWSVGGMILTGENWSTGRETLYSVGGRWMNGYGTLVEWYWQGKTEVQGEKHYIAWVVGEWMGMEHWWNDTDRGNWSTGRETLYSVGVRWMNGYGTLVEWYWQWNAEVLGEKNYIVWVVGKWMGMEHWWNGTDGKTEVLGEKPVTVPLCPPQISHGLTWFWTQASAVTGRRLMAWAMT